jgi:mRNA-degrading endonuclease toxin of MazEF toxin-antitoxin module
MECGDIYLVSLDPSAGHEQPGKRPVLVVSPGKFNRLTGVPIVLPITTGGSFARTAGFTVSLMGNWHANDRRCALPSATLS